jgi:hypothetical protein
MILKNKLLLVLPAILLLSSCTTFQKPEEKIVVQTEYVERTIDVKPLPKAVKMPDVEWYVVNETNLDEFLGRVKADGGVVAFMAITPKGYEGLSIGIGELRRYILQQKEIIAYYEKAVTPNQPQTAEK